MPKSVVDTPPALGKQGDNPGIAVIPARPGLRLARRHRLSKARGLVLGTLIGLVVWGLFIWALFIWRLII